MPYVLGIDVGTSHTAAAVCRFDGASWHEAEDVRLSARSRQVSSVLYLSEDGSFDVGDAALRQAITEPGRIVRGFVERVGDEVPLVIGDRAYPAHDVTAALVMWVLDETVAREGAPPEHVVVTHRASWGTYRRSLLYHALRQAGLDAVTLLPEPIAAAENFAVRDRVASGDVLAVYGLGGGAFAAAVVRRTSTGVFELLESAESVDHVGGAQFDDVLLERVRAELGRRLDDLDPADPQSRLAMFRLRLECTAAKERLSAAVETAVDVWLPRTRDQVRVTRTEFEEAIRPALESTVDTVRRTIRSAQADLRHVVAVVLVGGSSRIPLVAELVAAGLPCRVAVEVCPEGTIARGAALAGRGLAARSGLPQPVEHTTVLARVTEADRPLEALAFGPDVSAQHPEPPPRPAVEITPLTLRERRSVGRLVPGIRPAAFAAIVTVLVAAGIVLVFVLQAGIAVPTTPRMGGANRPAEPTRSQLVDQSSETNELKDSGR